MRLPCLEPPLHALRGYYLPARYNQAPQHTLAQPLDNPEAVASSASERLLAGIRGGDVLELARVIEAKKAGDKENL